MLKLISQGTEIKEVPNLYQPSEKVKRLTVHFKDKNGRSYYWLPKWAEVAGLFKQAYDVEAANEGGLEDLFRETAFHLIRSRMEKYHLNSEINELDTLAEKLGTISSWNLAKACKFDTSDLDDSSMTLKEQ